VRLVQVSRAEQLPQQQVWVVLVVQELRHMAVV
jgi:hypothetical protein